MSDFKFRIGDELLRKGRTETRKVIRYEHGHYILTDNKNTLGEIFWNKIRAEEEFYLIQRKIKDVELK